MNLQVEPDNDDLDVPTYLRYSKPTPPSNIDKVINLTDSNLQAISVMNHLNDMKSGEVLKVEGEISDTCAMNIREYTGAKVLRRDGASYVTCTGTKNTDYLDVPAILRSMV